MGVWKILSLLGRAALNTSGRARRDFPTIDERWSREPQKIRVAFLEGKWQLDAWLKHQKRQKEHQAQLS
jgi:hypothetical protein